MKRALASPYVWIALAAAVALASHAALGNLRVHEEPDTASYRDFDASTLEAALSEIRTFGYPLFLKGLGALGIGEAEVPFIHFVVSVLAACVFCAGLQSAGFGRPAAAASSGSLLFLDAGRGFLSDVTPDSLALSLAVASTGVFFVAISRRGNWLAFAALAALTFLTYQFRPAYLFLIPLWPALALVLETFLTRREDPVRRRIARLGGYLVATALPFLLFCGLRLALVGHFGLVSFGGYNVVGIAAQFLDEPLAREMPGDLRPLAEEIVRRRSDVQGIAPPTDFYAMEASYNPTVWGLTVPVAREFAEGDEVRANDSLSRLSGEIIRRRPQAYARWLFWNGKHAVRQCLTLAACDVATLLIVAALVGMHAFRLVRGRSVLPEERIDDRPETLARRRTEDHLLLWTAGAFCAAKALLVVGVEPAIGRYMVSAVAFVPPAIAVLAARSAERLAPWRERDRASDPSP
ncbi:MAG TPA: hypothetical protein VGN57_07975 [Pirellulaceae bacterium]|jgi:hypothetical protein|nr:hypothetical protein [Pirellulaceae bacterium]